MPSDPGTSPTGTTGAETPMSGIDTATGTPTEEGRVVATGMLSVGVGATRVVAVVAGTGSRVPTAFTRWTGPERARISVAAIAATLTKARTADWRLVKPRPRP